MTNEMQILFQRKSVLDLGCGLGHYGKAFDEGVRGMPRNLSVADSGWPHCIRHLSILHVHDSVIGSSQNPFKCCSHAVSLEP